MTTRRLLIAPLLLIAAAALAFAACNDGDGGESGAPSPPAADETPPAAETPADGALDGDATEEPTAEVEPPTADGDVVEVMMVPGLQFSPQEVNVPAGASFTILANNTAGGVPHSFALYVNQETAANGGDPLAETDICSGPCEDEVQVNLSTGAYYFRCEVHGDSMSGALFAE